MQSPPPSNCLDAEALGKRGEMEVFRGPVLHDPYRLQNGRARHLRAVIQAAATLALFD